MNDTDIPIVSTAQKDKKSIIDLFLKNVKGRKADTAAANIDHDGKAGHWLETAMGIKHNGDNAPDILGYEMKNATSSKTTFGDWSPDYQIFKGDDAQITRSEFLKIFGKPNNKKDGRLSWSGEPIPKIGAYNTFGQRLEVDRYNNIVAIYNYEDDKREDKESIVPDIYKKGIVVLAIWTASLMRLRVENKFNKSGWFKCEKDPTGVYTSIAFGPPIPFEVWISHVKTGKIFFDSGMYEGNIRPYAQWRADNTFWDAMTTERY